TIGQFLAVKTLAEVEPLLSGNPTGLTGLKELHTVLDLLAQTPLQAELRFDVTLARGLSYYTGAIFEVEVDTRAHPSIKMGSIASGGRYADLTSIFGLLDTPGVGISFGAERIYDVLEELQLFPPTNPAGLEVLVLCLETEQMNVGFGLVSQLRRAGLRADLYPVAAKLPKMLKYADQRGAPWVVLMGSEEAAKQVFTVKNMNDGAQQTLSTEALTALLLNQRRL
ncbi:MAG: histidine--tRNA ligase, partial [Lewinella sp.]|nr:histidine--tRNA ligase [Lewinella sp.]